MARRTPATARRALARIKDAGSDRAQTIAQFIVREIATNPATPYDPRVTTDTHGQHLRNSYKVRPAADGSGDWVITSNRRYWVFVEFGTREHGDAQPHVRPAIELARQVFR